MENSLRMQILRVRWLHIQTQTTGTREGTLVLFKAFHVKFWLAAGVYQVVSGKFCRGDLHRDGPPLSLSYLNYIAGFRVFFRRKSENEL